VVNGRITSDEKIRVFVARSLTLVTFHLIAQGVGVVGFLAKSVVLAAHSSPNPTSADVALRLESRDDRNIGRTRLPVKS